MPFRKFYYVYLKNREFLQDFKNLAGGKLKLPKKELEEFACLHGFVFCWMVQLFLFFYVDKLIKECIKIKYAADPRFINVQFK